MGGPGGVFGNPSPAQAAGGMTGGTAKASPPKKLLPIKTVPDPFLVTWKKAPPPPYVFERVEPIRLASVGVATPPPPNTEIREVPRMRVSGIMTGNGVYAILEGGGAEPEIVKPGSRTKDGYRVVSINADSVKLQKKQGNIILTQVVPLTDVPINGAQTAGYPGGGYPGMGGGRPGMPGRPGLPGRPGGGGGSKGGEE